LGIAIIFVFSIFCFLSTATLKSKKAALISFSEGSIAKDSTSALASSKTA